MRRASLSTRLALLSGAAVALPTLFACLDHPLKPVEYELAGEDMEGIQIQINKDVDILFVIDNSGSMGEEQENLSANFASFINVLEREEVKANYRIGITTTDNGNPICQGTGPEGGSLVLTSCQGRLGEFIFTGAQGEINAQAACEGFCDLDNIAITPTTTLADPEAKPRPWLESIEGATNLPDGLDTVTAFQCLGPQGIRGCGFESHLESMYKALVRSTEAGDASEGFLRPGAILSIVFVTDEVDCSHNNAQNLAFQPDGSRVFWSLPDEGQPTSAVCWNAGVECTPDASPFAECHSANFDVEGNPLDEGRAAEAAVLRPVSRYVDFVKKIEAEKKAINSDQEVLVAAISGVPQGYDEGTAEIQYQDSATGTPNDANFQANFGIGPGCLSTVAEAVPPVRLREFAAEFQVGDQRNLFSVCNEDYSSALEAIAKAIEDQIRPACMPSCVADQDPLTRQVEPQCVLNQQVPTGDGFITTPIPECVDAAGTIPDGQEVCYVALGDSGMNTPSTDDDLSQACLDLGWNLEFRVVRKEGVAAPGGTQVSATCALSQDSDIDCPSLP